MSSGHASHKGTSNKPNVNANDQLSSDLEELNVRPDEALPAGELKREGTEKPEALERPSQPEPES
ncbi:hypothetical protein STA3757_13500 [Stanieria sp. NIES-3757]|nr:hypothetical protein STA3757_13500 [Stanieria sp. NIES-3757]